MKKSEASVGGMEGWADMGDDVVGALRVMLMMIEVDSDGVTLLMEFRVSPQVSIN